MVSIPHQVYQLTVSLNGIEPSIWRTIQVPDHYSFWDLHVAIQDAMGWKDYHLHEFVLINSHTRQEEIIGIPEEEDEFSRKTLAGWNLKIKDYWVEGQVIDYVYDFGDGWTHTILLEKKLPVLSSVSYPCCIGGERACPPEDCGGVGGYLRLLDILFDPIHEEYSSMKQWVGEHFQPEEFDPKTIVFDNPRQRWEIAFHPNRR